MLKVGIAVVLGMAVALAGCAEPPSDDGPSFVPPAGPPGVEILMSILVDYKDMGESADFDGFTVWLVPGGTVNVSFDADADGSLAGRTFEAEWEVLPPNDRVDVRPQAVVLDFSAGLHQDLHAQVELTGHTDFEGRIKVHVQNPGFAVRTQNLGVKYDAGDP